MSTSGTYAFTVTRDQIIRQAMLEIGRLDPDEVPTANETNDCAFKLNMIVKQWQGKGDFGPGLKVWTRKHGNLFLRSTTGKYTVGPSATGWTLSNVATTTVAAAGPGAGSITVASAAGIVIGYSIGVELTSGDLFWTTVSNVVGAAITLNSVLPSASPLGAQVFCYQTTAQQPVLIETVVLRDNQGNDTPVRLLTVQDYDNLPSKVNPTNISDPAAIYYEFQLGNSNLYTDVAGAQDVTKYLVITFMEPVQDFNQALDNPYYPQEYYLALTWGLAKEICPMFKGVWTPLMESLYTAAIAIAKKKDPERLTIFFQPGNDE